MSTATSLAAPRPLRRVRVNVRSTSKVFLQNASVTAAGGAFVIVLVLFADDLGRGPSLFLGVALGVAACAASYTVPWSRLPTWAPITIPLLNLVALGVLAAGNIPVAMLTIFPVLTLARVHGGRAAALGVAAGTLVAWTPLIATDVVITAAHLPSLLLLPIVLATVAVTVSTMESSRTARSRLLSQQDGTLQRALEDLAAEREMLEGIVAALPAGVLVLDGRRVVLANAQVEHLYGPIDADALHLWQASSPADDGGEGKDEGKDPAEDSLAARAVAGERLRSETQWWRAADGDHKAVRGTTVALAGSAGVRPLRVVLFEDLTQEERAIEQREDFVSAVSHELRTPLTSVVGYLDLVREDAGVAPELADLLEIVDRNAQRVLRMVDDLAIASSLRDGCTTGMDDDVDLGAIARESLAAASYDAATAGVSVVDAIDGAWPVRGDGDRLRHAVDHLVHNAILYSDPGDSVTVTVRSQESKVSLLVIDRGIGISEADQERVFERFYRAPEVMRGSRHGTGLGLPVVREIVSSHRGEVRLRSRRGEGTEAEIVLPAPPAPAPTRGRELVP